MPRAVDGTRRTQRRKKLLNRAKGFWGRRGNLIRIAKDTVAKALYYSFRDRRAKKRDYRALWIARISAGCRNQGVTYSRFMEGLKKANILINRKVLANLALEDAVTFNALVEKAKEALSKAK